MVHLVEVVQYIRILHFMAIVFQDFLPYVSMCCVQELAVLASCSLWPDFVRDPILRHIYSVALDPWSLAVPFSLPLPFPCVHDPRSSDPLWMQVYQHADDSLPILIWRGLKPVFRIIPSGMSQLTAYLAHFAEIYPHVRNNPIGIDGYQSASQLVRWTLALWDEHNFPQGIPATTFPLYYQAHHLACLIYSAYHYECPPLYDPTFCLLTMSRLVFYCWRQKQLLLSKGVNVRVQFHAFWPSLQMESDPHNAFVTNAFGITWFRDCIARQPTLSKPLHALHTWTLSPSTRALPSDIKYYLRSVRAGAIREHPLNVLPLFHRIQTTCLVKGGHFPFRFSPVQWDVILPPAPYVIPRHSVAPFEAYSPTLPLIFLDCRDKDYGHVDAPDPLSERFGPEAQLPFPPFLEDQSVPPSTAVDSSSAS